MSIVKKPKPNFFEDYGPRFYMDYGFMKPHFSIPAAHIHPCYEALLILKEVKQNTNVNGQLLPPTSSPSLTIFAPYTMHQTYVENNDELERFVFYFTEDIFSGIPFVNDAFAPYKNNVCTRFEITDKFMDKILPFTKNARAHRKSKNLIILTFESILYIVTKYIDPKFKIESTDCFTNISSIIKYMADHCCDPITAETVCKHFSISRSKLNKDFTNNLSISFHQLLTEMRISKACYLLTNDNNDIQTIAEMMGFKDDTYFYTFFKRNTGMSPHQFRKSRKFIKAPPQEQHL